MSLAFYLYNDVCWVTGQFPLFKNHAVWRQRKEFTIVFGPCVYERLLCSCGRPRNPQDLVNHIPQHVIILICSRKSNFIYGTAIDLSEARLYVVEIFVRIGIFALLIIGLCCVYIRIE